MEIRPPREGAEQDGPRDSEQSRDHENIAELDGDGVFWQDPDRSPTGHGRDNRSPPPCGGAADAVAIARAMSSKSSAVRVRPGRQSTGSAPLLSGPMTFAWSFSPSADWQKTSRKELGHCWIALRTEGRCPFVIARSTCDEAIRFLLFLRLDCFASLAMTGT